MSIENDPSVSGVVTLVAQHLFLLPELLSSLTGDEYLKRLVIVASGLNRRERYRLKKAVEKIPSDLDISIVDAPLQSAGANRNVGFMECLTGLILFMDADDLYSPHRSKVALSLFKMHQFDLMLHGFIPFSHGARVPSFPVPPRNSRKLEIVREASLYERTLVHTRRNRELELRGQTDTTNVLFNDSDKAFEVQHAHAIVRREGIGDIRYHEVFGVRNEDGVFARDMLEAGRRVLLTPFPLSAYRSGARAKPKNPVSHFLRR